MHTVKRLRISAVVTEVRCYSDFHHIPDIDLVSLYTD